jgi:hypothetical protein
VNIDGGSGQFGTALGNCHILGHLSIHGWRSILINDEQLCVTVVICVAYCKLGDLRKGMLPLSTEL